HRQSPESVVPAYGSRHTDSGPRGSSYSTSPLSFIRWTSYGMREASPGPRRRIRWTTGTLPRRRNAAIITSCVGSYIGRTPPTRILVKILDRHYTPSSGEQAGILAGGKV